MGLSFPSRGNRVVCTELVPQNPNMTQVCLKMADCMATRVMVWAGEHPRTHSALAVAGASEGPLSPNSGRQGLVCGMG